MPDGPWLIVRPDGISAWLDTLSDDEVVEFSRKLLLAIVLQDLAERFHGSN